MGSCYHKTKPDDAKSKSDGAKSKSDGAKSNLFARKKCI